MKKNWKIIIAMALILCCVFAVVSCAKPQEENKTIRVSTTTSVNDSGLMKYLNPYFEADTGYKLEVASAGTGAAINAAKYGNADVILVHSKSQEEAFVTAGFGRIIEGKTAERLSFMYNYFVLVGPNADPAGAENAADVKTAFANIASTQSKFISRGDNSGTHTAEVKLWNADLGITAVIADLPQAIKSWYISPGQGMGACLTMANEQNAYVLTDKATYLSYKNNADGDKLPNLKLLYEEDNSLKNTYTMIAVKPDAPFTDASGNVKPADAVTLNTKGADVFINWMLSEHAKALIAFYGTTDYGAPLFYLL